MLERPPWRATARTRDTAARPPTKAMTWARPMPSQALPAPTARAGTRIGAVMASTAPSEAPAAEPMT